MGGWKRSKPRNEDEEYGEHGYGAGSEDGGDAYNGYERIPRSLSVFHNKAMTTALISGFFFIASGAVVRIQNLPVDLKLLYTSSETANNLFVISTMAFALGGACLGVFVLSLFIRFIPGGFLRALLKLLFFFYALTVAVCLMLTAAVAISAFRGISIFGMRDFALQGWVETVQNDVAESCRIQDNLGCYGFSNGECTSCPISTTDRNCTETQLVECPVCSDFKGEKSFGCYDQLWREMRNYLLPVAFIGLILSLLITVDIVIVCIF